MEGSLDQHEYLADRVKLAAYEAALTKAVQPGHVILDLGCGSGVLGLMALRAGAERAYFIDHGSVIEVARRTVTEAGFGERAEFFEASSFEVEIPERLDLVVCDHVGYFGFDYGVLEVFADARRRFLKPDGILVPSSLDIYLSPVESEQCRKHVHKWTDGSIPEQFGWLSEMAANTKYPVNLDGDSLLAHGALLTTLNLGQEESPFHSWNAEFVCLRDGLLDGVAGWFDACLFDDVRMTNSPSAAERLTRPEAFFPLENPVAVSAGESIKATVMARPEDNVIGWVIELPASGQRFALNTFNGMTLDREAIVRADPGRIAGINQRGRARQVVLSYCDGKRTIGEVQKIVLDEHPDLFPSIDATKSFVTRVLSCDTSE